MQTTVHERDAFLLLRGVAGVVLGAYEMARPSQIMRMDGLSEGAKPLVRLAGAHKAVAGAGLIASEDPTPWLAGALAGSAYDGFALAWKQAKPAAYARLAALAVLDLMLLMKTSARVAA